MISLKSKSVVAGVAAVAFLTAGVVGSAQPASAVTISTHENIHNLMVTPRFQGWFGSYAFTLYFGGKPRYYTHCIKAQYGKWESTDLKVPGDEFGIVQAIEYGDTACHQPVGDVRTTFYKTQLRNWWWTVPRG